MYWKKKRMIDDIISQDMIQENNYSLCNKQWVRIVFIGISFVYARASSQKIHSILKT